ncbi:YdcF family protein [Candidatus Sumerlaeota bacterium]|nr:YdcF family protein [Candidatus Sumerlaeota bacterium]
MNRQESRDLSAPRGRRARTSGVRLVALGLLVPAATLLSLAGRIYVYSSVSDPGSADAAIVLGAAVYKSRLSPVFEERIKHAIRLLDSGRVRYVVFTGGLAKGDRIAESEAGRQYALRQGVAESRILYENVSRTTYENLREARAILSRENLGRVLVVSDPMHMRRALTMARDLGIDAYPSPTTTTRYRTWRGKLGFVLREAPVYAGYLAKRPFLIRPRT